MTTVARTGQVTAKALVCFALLPLALSTAKAENQPSARVVRCAPERVVALARHEAAIVAWVLAETCRDVPPITSYTISAFDDEAPLVVASTAEVDAAGAEVRGLSLGHCYSFSAQANTAAGSGPESERSEEICLPAPGADIELSMTAPASGSPGAELTFTMKVTNHGAADATRVSLVDPLPAPLAAFSTTQGVCQGAVGGTQFGCLLGALDIGASATVSVTVRAGNMSITNTAWATAYDPAGAVLPDREPENNAASATVRVEARQKERGE